jgi:hypothetical protein
MRVMRLIALGLTLLAAGVIAPAAAAQESPADPPLVRLRDGHGSDLLFRVHPRTLRPLARPIRTFRSGYGLAFSPDGGILAYSDGSRARSRIHFVDVARWRSLGVAGLGRRGPLLVGWVSDDRVLAIAGQGFGRQQLILLDVTSRKVVARRPFAGLTLNALTIPGGYALALAPNRGIGPLRILLVDAQGGVRNIRLDGVESGGTESERRGRFLTPGVALDSEGGRLYVVAARGLLVAEVELASGAVSYHPLGASASKGNIDVWWRQAAWAGNGRIAVTGQRWRPGRRRRPPPPPEPFGIRIIDTSDWSTTTLDPRPTEVHVSGDTVLANGTRWFDGGRRSESTGLLAFDATGRRTFTRFRGQDVATVGSRGHVAYVWVRRTRTLHVIDLRDGRSLNEIRTGRRIPFLLTPPAVP